MNRLIQILPLAISLGILGYFLSGAVFLTALFGGICYVIYRATDPEDRNFVLAVLIAGFAVRALLAVSLHAHAYLHKFHSISGDDLLYTIKSWALVHRWEAKPESWAYEITTATKGYGMNPFTFILASFFKIFGFHPVAGKFINCIIGSMIGWVSYLIAVKIFDKPSGRIAMVAVMFYPSLVRWSIANLKDPLMIFLFTLCIYLFLDAMYGKAEVWKYALMGCSMVLLFFFAQVFYFVLSLTGFIVMVSTRTFSLLGRQWARAAAIAAVVVLCVAAVYFLYVDTRLLVKILYMCEETQIAIAKSDYAGYYFYKADFMKGLNRGVIDVPQLITIAFVGIAYFMLAPLPWQMTTLSRLHALPQMLIWYVVLAFGFFGFLKLVFEKPRIALLFGAIFVIGITVNSLAEGNIGAAFRHRDIFTPLFIVLAAGVAGGISPVADLQKEGAA